MPSRLDPNRRCVICSNIITLPRGRFVCSMACRGQLTGGQNREVHSAAMKDELRRLWAEGHSTAEIGRRLGVTKNSVVSLRRRMKLTPRPTLFPATVYKAPAARGLTLSGPAAAVPFPPRKLVPAAVPTPPESPPPVHFVRVRECQWMDGDGPFVACGAPAEWRCPYCAEHRQRAWTGVLRAPRAA